MMYTYRYLSTHTYVYILGERERGERRGSQAIQGSLLSIGEGNSEKVPQRLTLKDTGSFIFA